MGCTFRNNYEVLHKANKPYQYVGGEYMSANKNFDEAVVKFALVFPDKYEIGISNLGVRILYDRINSESKYMADRAYAPESDFKPDFLYGVESKRPLKDFDGIGFSLQYEMAYPTVLKLLEMSGVSVKNNERNNSEPIIFAGGPCTFNPLPMSDFIDVFCIGDGEEMMLEVCRILEQTKGKPRNERIQELCKIKGCWSKLTGGTVEKRISPLLKEYVPTKYPIPFSGAVHDRAIIEIRRGCGRMCRFCQPGHVTLPIRERSAEDIIDLTKETIKNTGYDEYSLLSLSSNDYPNIKDVIKELAVDFDKKKISVSLPSQRIDGFSLELANLTQTVRKGGMTLAPEAGSQRLRNVIKKNISEEQIIDAALTLYENGWSKLKFYFICGLPTETNADMEEMARLLDKIKYRARLIKKEKGLNHGFDITCTLSIFVPKPFTPFQWCPQMDLDVVTEHIRYLKESTKHIKGLKINYHEQIVSQIEAMLTRGEEDLCGYIYSLYKKGCYLDAWGEYFNKDLWIQTAEECGFSIKDKAAKEYNLEENLPWDFINTGLSKEWLQKEYETAMMQGCEFNLQKTCEHKCVNCGVCPSLNTKKVLSPKYTASKQASNAVKTEKSDPSRANINPDIPVYKYRLKITKMGLLKYFSHLDWQNTFHKALARCGLRMNYTLGFNPTMKVSMGVALPLFSESEGELVDIEILDKYTEDELMNIIQPNLPNGAKILEINEVDRFCKAIETEVQWAEYKITPYNKFTENTENCSDKEVIDKNAQFNFYGEEDFKRDAEKILSMPEILLTKKNKKGNDKTINIKKSIGSYRFEGGSLLIYLKAGQGSDIPALRADNLAELINPQRLFEITRLRFLNEELKEL